MSFCLSASLQLATPSTGESPFFLNSGQHPITPSTLVDCRTRADSVNIDNTPHNWLQHREEALRLAKDALAAAQARLAFYSDKGKTEMHLEVDDLVLIHRDFLITPEARDRPSDKLRPRWYGPFKFLEKVSSNAFRVDLPFQLRCHPVFNVSALKKYNKNVLEGRTVEPPPPITDLDGFQRYIVEKILSHRRRQGKLQYLVKWIGYNDATWEPEHFLKNEAGQDLNPLKRYKEMNPH